MKVNARPALLAGTTSVLALTLAVTGATTSFAAASPTPAKHHHKHVRVFTTSGRAFGSKVQLASMAGSGKSARTATGCGVTQPIRRSATGHVNLSTIGGAHAVRSISHTRLTASGASRTVTRARTAGVSLLGGLVKLRALRAKSIAHAGRHHRLRGNSRFVGLRIAGKLIKSNPKPNTRIDIPGIARLTLNRQVRTAHANGLKKLSVDALKLTLLHGSNVKPLGTTIRIGHTLSAVRPAHASALRGISSGSQITVGGLVQSNPTFASKLLCLGNARQPTRHRGASVNLPNILTTGAIRTKATGFSSPVFPKSSTKASVAHVNLLGGVVTATALRAQATAIRMRHHVWRGDDGTQFLGLTINGTPYTDSVTPNTKINLVGLGTLWLDRVVKAKHGVRVHGLELVLGTATAGLPKGAVIDIANARAVVKHAS